MNRISGIQELYKELHQIESDLKAFTVVRSAGSAMVLTQRDLDRYYNLRKRRDEIVAQLAELQREVQ